jgi:hypothetical protein
MNNGLFLFFSATLITIAIVGILRFLHFYNAYQRHLKDNHPDEYKKLILEDKLVETVGEWIRWPIGSAGPILAIFNIQKYYGDHDLFSLQRKALIWLVIFLLGLILSLILFPKYGTT